jgi:DNA-binding NtrC family response regulator
MLNIHEQTLFIVDDEPLIVKALEKKLTQLGYTNLKTFESGVDCIHSLAENPFVVLLDYQMDDLNGFEVLRKIKRYNPNTYVIMMSSQNDVSKAVETLKFGAFDYLVKGADDTKKLTNTLERIFKIEEKILAPRESLFAKLFHLF